MAILLDSRSDIQGIGKFELPWDKIVAELKRAPKNAKKIAAQMKKKDTAPAAETDQPGTSLPAQYDPSPKGMSMNTKIGIGLAGLGVVTLAGILIMKLRK